MTSWLSFLLVLSVASSAVLADETAASAGDGWGAITGRVVFEGDLQDPVLKTYREDVKIYEHTSLKKSFRGVKPREIAKVPNESLLIDPKTRGVKNAFVYLRTRPARVHPALSRDKPKPAEMVSRNQLFVPRVLILQVGQGVRMRSPDHATNVASTMLLNPPFNILVTPDKPAEWTPRVAEKMPIHVGSNIHPASRSWWLIVDHPYAVLTDRDGSFRLENVPEGNHELRIWHEAVEGWLEKKLPITVRAGETKELAPAKITADRLSPAT